ncbi:UPF0718 protein YcgR [Sporomusaceae bacterium FL31]|nr:UPF0718 protein YcgR [Sporomusaceae bacterium FL31]GCE34968.1 UPF0718 protein YcgR [Sporomusaceae bacterium]
MHESGGVTLYSNSAALGISSLIDKVTWADLVNFKMIFFSVVIEALPFILVGVFVSSVLNLFLSEELIQKLLPRNRFLGIIIASLLGVLLPLCECGIVPITRRLVQKGVPVYVAATFMLATPIINPVVLLATSVAFSLNPKMVWIRLGVAFLVSIITGIVLSFVLKGNQLKESSDVHCDCCSGHITKADSIFSKIFYMLKGACSEFFEMGKFLIAGALLSAIVQTTIPYTFLSAVGQAPFLSIIVMMVFAFFVSVCSSADAFIAASFGSSFTPGALIAFMVFGPMIDLKNTLMLYHSFRLRFVVTLIIVTVFMCISLSYLSNFLIGGL